MSPRYLGQGSQLFPGFDSYMNLKRAVDREGQKTFGGASGGEGTGSIGAAMAGRLRLQQLEYYTVPFHVVLLWFRCLFGRESCAQRGRVLEGSEVSSNPLGRCPARHFMACSRGPPIGSTCGGLSDSSSLPRPSVFFPRLFFFLVFRSSTSGSHPIYNHDANRDRAESPVGNTDGQGLL